MKTGGRFRRWPSLMPGAFFLCLVLAAVPGLAQELLQGAGETDGSAAVRAGQGLRYLIRHETFSTAERTLQSGVLRRRLAEAGGRFRKHIERFQVMSVEVDDAGQAQKLREIPGVTLVEPDVLYHPTFQADDYGIPLVQANLLDGRLGATITVCVLDTGLDGGHPDLAGNNLSGSTIKPAMPWNLDSSGHGTHVAGIVAALDNGIGIRGVLPKRQLRLHIVRLTNTNDIWGGDVIEGLAACQENGAHVVNMSFAGAEGSESVRLAMEKAYAEGMLLVAAAGNENNSGYRFPASYDSVISVAAVDRTGSIAGFSQKNDKVELAAPGDSVVSTLSSAAKAVVISYFVEPMTGSPDGTVVSAPVIDCGVGSAPCAGATGALCLIERGGGPFWVSVLNCQAGGGVGAIIYNNLPGSFSGHLSGVGTAIPSVSLSREEGQTLRINLPITADLAVQASAETATLYTAAGRYGWKSGTSMASAYVTGAAALAWSSVPGCTNFQVREALQHSAVDQGTPGRDASYGFGLVQASGAKGYLDSLCGTCPYRTMDANGDGDADGQDLVRFMNLLQPEPLQNMAAAFGHDECR